MELSDGEARYQLKYHKDGPVDPLKLASGNITALDYTTWYIRRGRVRLTHTGGTLRAREGQVVLFDPYVVRSHEFTGSPELVSVWFRVHCRGLDFFPPLGPPVVLPGKGLEPLIRAGREVCKLPADPETDPKMPESEKWHQATIFACWLAEWHAIRARARGRANLTLDPRIVRAMAMLELRITSWKTQRDFILRQVSLSAVHFTRLFRQATGNTPQEWVEARCFGTAQDRLRRPDESVKAVAFDLGFCDISHFSRWFAQRSGQRPREWRKRFSTGA